MKRLALLLVLLFACGQISQLHVTAVQGTKVGIEAAAEAIESVCTREKVMEVLQASGRSEALTFVARCNASVEMQHVAAELWEQWVTLLLAKAEGQAFDEQLAVDIARRMVRVYTQLQQLLHALGKDIPQLPELVRTLAGVE